MRAIRTVNGDSDNALADYIQPGKVIHLVVTTSPTAFPPAADFPNGGAFYLKAPAPLKLQTTADGAAWTIPAGYFPIAADEAAEFLLSAAEPVTVEVLSLKEKI